MFGREAEIMGKKLRRQQQEQRGVSEKELGVQLWEFSSAGELSPGRAGCGGLGYGSSLGQSGKCSSVLLHCLMWEPQDKAVCGVS